MEQTAKQWLTGGQKWLKSAGKKLASVAKEGASEVQKRLENVETKALHKGSFLCAWDMRKDKIDYFSPSGKGFYKDTARAAFLVE